MAPSTDACNVCGTAAGAICCFDASGNMKEGSCGNDGSFCSKQNNSNYCMKSSGEFNSPCQKQGDPCAIPSLTCQPDANNALKCLCNKDFIPCTADNTKMCDPGGAGPGPTPSSKFTGDCTADQAKLVSGCPVGQYGCYDGPHAGACNTSYQYFDDHDPGCNKVCLKKS